LVSDGGVHSSIEHLYALCTLAKQRNTENVFVHAITDGRDCGPKTGKGHIQKLQEHLKGSGGRIASVIGRYYAMDRDHRWERIKKAYDLLVHGKGNYFHDPVIGIQTSYNAKVTDEFIEPIVITDDTNAPIATIKEGDTVICFNFRTDRCREITIALSQRDIPEFEMKPLKLSYYTMTNYDDSFTNVEAIYKKDNLMNTLGETISKSGKEQLRIAETEKYPHVTFFFSGGRETTFDGEKRIIVNSPKVATYDLQPEMSAPEVTSRVCDVLTDGSVDFVCLNFANPDMVGHTGVQKAIIKAVETIDDCARRVVESGVENGYSFVIIADHGNADKMFNADGSPHTAHTTNLVPVFVIDQDIREVRNGILADIAPTILDLMNLRKPDEMTGTSLVTR
jgi:2,3-bisphosphoglycerate-independent phosphoglycerate mutase